MGVTTTLPPAPGTPSRAVRWLPPGLQTAAALQRLAVASVAANVLIVVTGGAVRLTGSGLGCPTWPRCTDASLTPTREYAIHGVIEFSNRMLTFVLAAIAIATWVVAMVRRTERRLATLAALSVPAQGVLGGITVLTHLNPWVVASHFLFSMAIIAVTFALWWRVSGHTGTAVAAPVRALVAVTALLSAATLVAGTVVTGSGPHAGALQDNHKVRRTGLDVQAVSQLHADLVMALIGATVGLVALVWAIGATESLRRAAVILLGVELAQGVIGFTQYFLNVPPLLVGFHMFGACLVWLATLNVVARTRATDRAATRAAVVRTAA